MSSKSRMARRSRPLTREVDDVEFGGFARVQVEDVFSTVPPRNLAGNSLKGLEAGQPNLNLEMRVNDFLDEFGVPDGELRRIVLTNYGKDHIYNANLIRAAGRLTMEMGFRGDYELTSLNWQHAFLSLT